MFTLKVIFHCPVHIFEFVIIDNTFVVKPKEFDFNRTSWKFWIHLHVLVMTNKVTTNYAIFYLQLFYIIYSLLDCFGNSKNNSELG